MKPVLLILLLAHTATAQTAEPPSAPDAGARPLAHVSERTNLFAEPSVNSKVVLVLAPTDELYTGATAGEWTHVELATGAGWIATARLEPVHVAAPGSAAVSVQASPQTDDEPRRRPVGKRFTNGFRLGWMYVANIDRMSDNGMTFRERTGLKSPHMFVMGYEFMFRAISHAGLNAIVVANASVAGLDQSKVIPSTNGLVGVEIEHSFQAAVGISLTPDPVAPTHMVLAAGWTPEVGSMQLPVHFIYIPDPDRNYRMGATVGMNW